jgi:hypothetical protein
MPARSEARTGMSYEQLMDHAYAIEEKATKKAIVKHSEHLGDQGPIAYSSIKDYRTYPEYRLFSDVPGLFQPFTNLPDPSSFVPLIDDLDRAVGNLAWGQATEDPIHHLNYPANPVLDKMAGAESYIENWTGKAAMDFKANFLDPFPSIEHNQFMLAAVLKAALAAHQALWQSARKNIDDIAHGTLEALDTMDDCGRNEWPIAWTVVACVAGALAAPLTGGGSLALTAVSTAAWVTAANPPKSAPTTTYGGETAEVVIQHMREAITHLTQDIQHTEQVISSALSNNHAIVCENRSLFVAARPALAGATAATVTGPDQMGYSL